jgi:phosphotransferase system IIB component
MTTSNAVKISRLILELADNKNVDRKVLENEIYQIVRNVHNDYADEIVEDLEFQNI